jgi:hypothetical protein
VASSARAAYTAGAAVPSDMQLEGVLAELQRLRAEMQQMRHSLVLLEFKLFTLTG